MSALSASSIMARYTAWGQSSDLKPYLLTRLSMISFQAVFVYVAELRMMASAIITLSRFVISFLLGRFNPRPQWAAMSIRLLALSSVGRGGTFFEGVRS